MNCEECREEFAAYLEGLLDETSRGRVDSHLAGCSTCQTELQEVRQLTARLAGQRDSDKGDSPIFAEMKTGTVPSVSLETAVMDRILHEQALEIRRLKMRKRLRVLGISGAMAAAIAVMLTGNYWFAQPAQAQKAAEVMAQGAEAVPNPSTVHIVAKLRTIPHDNFSFIDDKCDFVPVEVWRQFGDKPKWRVEKPGRVAVMDGESTVMLIRPNMGVKFPHASEGAFDSQWLLGLANVQDVITRELRTALAKGWDLKTANETTAAGEKKIVVTVEAKAGLPDNDYSKNKWFDESDMRRIYRFDAKTQRLDGFEAYLHRSEGDVLVMAIEKIEYGQPISPEVFSLKLPENVNWYKEPEQLRDNGKYEKMTPKEAAQAFFEACGKEDWVEVEKFFSPVGERLKSYLGGLKLVSLGKPFQSKTYPGWFVPYEIKLTVKAKIVVRNDNPAKRYLVFMDPERVPDAKTLAGVKKLPDNEKYEKMTPKEAARAFFDAWARKDVKEIRNFLDGPDASRVTPEDLEDQRYADVQVGEPTKAKDAGCWLVPIEIRFTNKHNLALRNDNPAKRYVVDGGI